MTFQRNLLAIVIVSALGIGPALSQDAPPPPPPEEQPMDPVADVPDDTLEPAEPSQPTVPTQRLASRYTDLLGTEQNATNLVTGLRTGGPVTLDQELVGTDGTITTTSIEFQPATGTMGFGEIDNALALAEADLTAAGIADPTLDELATALNGGSLVDTQGNAVDFSGVLQLRSEGMGWGQIANTLGFRMGDVKGNSARADLDAQAAIRAADRVSLARVDRPQRPERLDRPSKPERPERPERPDRGGRPGG